MLGHSLWRRTCAQLTMTTSSSPASARSDLAPLTLQPPGKYNNPGYNSHGNHWKSKEIPDTSLSHICAAHVRQNSSQFLGDRILVLWQTSYVNVFWTQYEHVSCSMPARQGCKYKHNNKPGLEVGSQQYVTQVLQDLVRQDFVVDWTEAAASCAVLGWVEGIRLLRRGTQRRWRASWRRLLCWSA